MINIKVDIDTRGLEQFKQFSERRLRAAIATSLTRTANEAKKGWQNELRTKLDRPTPYTVNSVRTEMARADKLEAVVAVKDQGDAGATLPAEYLKTQQGAADRNLRRFERALVKARAMPAGYKVVPARFALLDGYGNITKGQIVSVLRQLAGEEVTKGYRQVISANAKKRAKAIAKAGRDYVAVVQEAGELFPGVWQRKGKSLVPVFRYVRRTVYPQKIDLYRQARDIVNQQLQAQFDRAMRESAERLASK